MKETTVFKKAGKLITDVKEHWNTPAKGNYIPYKETASLSAACFGSHWATLLGSTIALDASNLLVGSSLHIEPLHLQYMLILANILGTPIGIWRSWYIDNHNMKGGKFLLFLIRTPLPIFLLSTIMVWLPFEAWTYSTKVIVVWLFYFLIQIFLCFYNEAYQTLFYVTSPNTHERASTMSIVQIISSMAPTVSNLVIPLIASMTWGLNNIQTYRIIYPPFTLFGLIVSIFFFRKVKERIVTPKKKLEHIRILDAVREISKNKYFWILTSASWVGFLEGAYGVILSWTFIYSSTDVKTQAGIGVANTIIGNGALWAMMAAPFLMKRLGKRNLLILCNLLNVALLVFLCQVYKNIWLVCVFWYINNFINVINNNLNLPNINADMRDYHQWKTGVRIDGLFGPLGLISTFIGFSTGLIIPTVYEKMGLKDNYDVLYDDSIRFPLIKVLIIMSIVGALLNLIPYLFYDLTESKHKGYVDVLKIRAMFEDYGNGDLDDERLVDGMEIICTAKDSFGKTPLVFDKALLKKAKKLPGGTDEEKQIRKEKIAQAKSTAKEYEAINLNIFTASFVLDEINKFSTERYIRQTERAEHTFSKNALYLWDNLDEETRKARALPKGTKEEKEIRSDAFALIRAKKISVKLIKKYGKENITEPDEKIKQEIQERDASSLKETLRARKELRAYSKALSVYARAIKPYEDARKLLQQQKDYSHLYVLEEKYHTVINK